MNEDLELTNAIEQLIIFARKITNAHIKNRGSVWGIDSQIARMHEEVSEVYRATRKNEGIARIIEEDIDVIMSALTHICIETVDTELVKCQLIEVKHKLEKRVGLRDE